MEIADYKSYYKNKMQIIRDIKEVSSEKENETRAIAIALGNFDGLHLGHQAIIAETLSSAKSLGIPAAIMTFEPHPREFFARLSKSNDSDNDSVHNLRLMSIKEKIAAFREAGIDIIYMLRFNSALAGMKASEFVDEILIKKLSARAVITGDNFCFGKGRGGNSESLKQQSEKGGFLYRPVSPVLNIKNNSEIISSSLIRNALSEGNIAKAESLLGRKYKICGHVIGGEKRGRILGFPTANISMRKLFPPKYGVYSVDVELEGKIYSGVSNIGIRPSFNENRLIMETHLFEYSTTVNGELYGKYIKISLKKFLRDEQKFPSIEELKKQIEIDCEIAKRK